jgi:D-glycerate 3-kinase
MSNTSGQLSLIQAAGEAWLAENSRLDSRHRHSLAACAARLTQRIRAGQLAGIGIAAPPGTGKSTLSHTLVHLLARMDITACVVSLDDYYLPLADRQELADRVHPLFLTRGVPGTHDLDRLLKDLDRLSAGDIDGLKMPVFDKSRDDRSPESRWQAITVAPSLLILEGWLIGAPPQAAVELAMPVNGLERSQDPDNSWRKRVNDTLGVYHDTLAAHLDECWYVRVPGWDCVVDWRWQQEQELPEKSLASREEVASFLSFYQRIVGHMQRSCQVWADLILEADPGHLLRYPETNGNQN